MDEKTNMQPKPGDVVKPDTVLVEVTPPAPPIEPTTIPMLSAPHKPKALYAAILAVVLVVVGVLVYFMFFRKAAPLPAPIEVKETTESTMPARTVQEDVLGLPYIETQFRSLDGSVTELTNDTEIGTQLNLGTPTNNISEL